MVNVDLQFLHGLHTPKCDYRLDKIFHGYRTLQYLTQGSIELFYDETRYVIESPTFWPACDGPRIRFHPAQGHTWWEHRYIAFQGPLAERWAAAGLLPTVPEPAPRGLLHEPVFDEMLTLAKTMGRWSQLRAINLLESILLELAEHRTQRHDDDDLVNQVTQILSAMMNAPGGQIDYAVIADELNMGLSTLRRRFSLAAGTSLHAWVLDEKISAAMQWLGETDWPIKTIAHKLGYRDVYFFSRQFGQKVGVPPAAYRRTRQG